MLYLFPFNFHEVSKFTRILPSMAGVLEITAPHFRLYNTYCHISGHCDPVCACQVNGEYYAVGEKWATPKDPCTVFECFTNGFVEAISQGKTHSESLVVFWLIYSV